MIWIILAALFVRVEGTRIEYRVKEEGEFIPVLEDFITIQAGERFSLRCRFQNQNSSSVLWEINSKAWKQSLWLDPTQMGLHESTGKEEFTTEVYVTNAGTKDVGFYECIDSETSDVDIDSGGVYVYVIGGRLTPLHPDKIPPLSNLENFPCIAAHTGVTVDLLAEGEDVTNKYDFDPRSGFSRKAQSVSMLSLETSLDYSKSISSPEYARTNQEPTSFTCRFNFENRTELVNFTILPSVSQVEDDFSAHIQANFDPDSEDSLAQITCKIKSLPRNLGLELAWGLPAKGLELLTKDHPDVLFTDRYSIEEEYIEDILISTLSIQELTEEDQGTYSCHVSRVDKRTTSAETYLNVEDLVMTTFRNIPPFSISSSAVSASAVSVSAVSKKCVFLQYFVSIISIYYIYKF